MTFKTVANAAAIIGGIAALVRAKYPSMTNRQVMDRIIQTSGDTCGMPVAWHRLANAVAAVGGICYNRQIAGPTELQAQSTTTGYFCAYPSGGAAPLTYLWTNGATGQCSTYSFPRGSYTASVVVTVTDPATQQTESSVAKSVKVTYRALEGVTIAGPTSISKGQVGTWTASPVWGAPQFNYKWYVNGTLVQQGVDASVYSRTGTGVQFNLQVTVTDAINATATSTITVGVGSGSGGCTKTPCPTSVDPGVVAGL